MIYYLHKQESAMPDFSDDQIAAAWNIAESIELTLPPSFIQF